MFYISSAEKYHGIKYSNNRQLKNMTFNDQVDGTK